MTAGEWTAQREWSRAWSFVQFSDRMFWRVLRQALSMHPRESGPGALR